MKKYLRTGLVGVLLASVLGITGCGANTPKESKGFQPSLDTEEKVVLSTTGFFGNFEALDQVINDFNQYYPNVEFTYEQVSGGNFEDYMDANPNVDIIMTSEELFGRLGSKLEDKCADLTKENIDFSAIREDMLARGYRGESLYAIPMGQNMYGLAVNKTLLEKEGLSVPNNYAEFIDVCTALKAKGYTPIQGPNSKVYAELMYNMAFDMILDDKDLYNDLVQGREQAVDALLPVFEKMDTFIDQGFIDASVNEAYPEDNYDQAILNFFEGNVPFWVCNTEKISGMKKRESKSEAFQANPFEYSYIFAPLGEKGAYAYSEPWVGFSVNKNSEHYDYAVEFMRFLATKDEINKMGDIKGIPSVAKEDTGVAIYQSVMNPENADLNCINKGEISNGMIENWYSCTTQYAAGEFATDKEALEAFVRLCSEQNAQ